MTIQGPIGWWHNTLVDEWEHLLGLDLSQGKGTPNSKKFDSFEQIRTIGNFQNQLKGRLGFWQSEPWKPIRASPNHVFDMSTHGPWMSTFSNAWSKWEQLKKIKMATNTEKSNSKTKAQTKSSFHRKNSSNTYWDRNNWTEFDKHARDHCWGAKLIILGLRGTDLIQSVEQ
jgi:hypothetical protein